MYIIFPFTVFVLSDTRGHKVPNADIVTSNNMDYVPIPSVTTDGDDETFQMLGLKIPLAPLSFHITAYQPYRDALHSY